MSSPPVNNTELTHPGRNCGQNCYLERKMARTRDSGYPGWRPMSSSGHCSNGEKLIDRTI